MKPKTTKAHVTSIIITSLAFAFSSLAAVLDFEQVYGVRPFEGMAISNQFAGVFGMRFSSFDGTHSPIIAQQGSPGRIFGGSGAGYDGIYSTNAVDHGDFFLGDPRTDVEQGPKGFVVTFDQPVSTFSLYLLDLDGDERVTLTAFASEADTSGLATNVFYSTNAPFGSGLSGPASISVGTKLIYRVEVRAQGRGGYAKVGFDDFTSDYTPPAQPAAQLGLRLYPGLAITGAVGTPYRVDYADSLDVTPTSTNWHELTTIFLPQSPYLFFDSSPAASPSRFYRAVGVQ
jgi:hypothetical protein